VPTSGRQPRGVFVTTSWDDGHVMDHRLAELLATHGLPGTFYVAPRNVELAPEDRLDDKSLQTLAQRFEIGGHTLTHLRLTGLSDATALQEIKDGKDAIEQIIASKLESFCYPGGEYAVQHPRMVADAGFSVGRTVRRWVSSCTPALEMDTTVNAYRHLVDGPAVVRLARGNLLVARRYYWNWDILAIALFEQILSRGSGIFHLWGHSWEIDKNGDWARLERVLAYVGGRDDVEYVNNQELAVRTTQQWP